MRVSKLRDICSNIQYGYTQSSSTENIGPKFLRITDIQDNKVNWETTPYCEITHKDLEKYRLSTGDIVVARTGATTGKSLLIKSPPVAVFASYLIKLSVNKELALPDYVWWFMQSPLYWNHITISSNGTTQPGVNATVLSELVVPLPSIEDQIQISNVLDKARSLIDKRKQAIAKLDELVQAVFLNMFGDPVSNDRAWSENKFNQCILNVESGWSPVCKNIQANEDEWGVLKLSAVTSGLYIASENKAIQERTIPKPKLEVSKGDLLFVRKNTLELVGTCAYVFDSPSKLMLPDTIFRLVLKEDCKMNKLFLWQLLNNPKYKKQIQKLAGGTAGSMPNISKSKLLNFEVIYPDPELQSKFSVIVEKIELQKRKQFQSLQQLESNFQALLQKAFKGELKVKDGVAV